MESEQIVIPNEGETNIRITSENDFFRLSEVNFINGAESTIMYRLDAKIKGKYITVRRFIKDVCHPPYDYEHDPLSRLMLECMNDNGYIAEYSGKLNPNEVHGDEYGVGNPLEEIDNRIMYEKPDELRNGFITFSNMGKGIYQFNGNHEHYSGAFSYIIWDKEIVKKIKSHLKENPTKLFRSRSK